MTRWILGFLLIASLLTAAWVWWGVLRMRPAVEARRVSDELVDEAQAASARGDRQTSKELIDEALQTDRENPRAHRELAMHLITENRRDQALKELQYVAETRTDDSGAARELAALFWTMGDKENAIRWLREAVRRDPKNGLALVELAQCLLESGDAAGAVGAAEDAVTLYPRWQSAWLALGFVKRESGDLEGAKEALDEALQLLPDDVDTLLAAADVAYGLNQIEAATGYARRAVAADPQYATAWFVLAHLLQVAGEGTEAQDALRRARSLGAVPTEQPQQPPRPIR